MRNSAEDIYATDQSWRAMCLMGALVILSALSGRLLAAVEIADEYIPTDQVVEGDISQSRVTVTLTNTSDEPVFDVVGQFLGHDTNGMPISPTFGPTNIAGAGELEISEIVTIPAEEMESWSQGSEYPRLRVKYIDASGEETNTGVQSAEKGA